ncbi:MAG: hypothetical protein UR20_C0041G0005 [Candidatus Woesebacteria bacterium GW2011_GWE2_31_6]|nr:MAG: hypothetical protein UR20_C0041G0005 [Candidatus Woesebacteria bacterium GW2011_GWE2_31_6]
MSFEEDVKNWRELSDMFFSLEIQTENDFKEGKITKIQRDVLRKKIKKDWDYNMIINNPFIKNNATLKEVAKGFFKMDDLS